ncbi:hypothetical protein scyTo_0015130 [Scyliorhinus torazame]|uniref:Cation efflux protein transmembrane domain-containing protein n=1 Tax=Scyliorhinus torazame TaxID=75743 RepID=A0A401P384_SCYTO|nr:hypothetical protein [Scyliorhinus torazame]
MDQFVDSEKANLITENKARMYSLRLKSPFSSSKEVYPNYPFDNGNSANSIELERYASQHCHSRSTSDIENREKLQARRKLYIAAIICLIFMVGEVVGGYLAHSLAIMTDAAHLLTDFGSMLVRLLLTTKRLCTSIKLDFVNTYFSLKEQYELMNREEHFIFGF